MSKVVRYDYIIEQQAIANYTMKGDYAHIVR